jgi:flagellar basal body-associated protein FliL
MTEQRTSKKNRGIVWIIAIIIVVAVAVGYQIVQNQSGSQVNGTVPGTEEKADDERGTNDQTGKPGETPKE